MTEIERVKVEGGVDIFQTVKAARAHRPHMVCTSVSNSLRPIIMHMCICESRKLLLDTLATIKCSGHAQECGERTPSVITKGATVFLSCYDSDIP